MCSLSSVHVCSHVHWASPVTLHLTDYIIGVGDGHHGLSVEVRGQLLGIGSHLPLDEVSSHLFLQVSWIENFCTSLLTLPPRAVLVLRVLSCITRA